MATASGVGCDIGGVIKEVHCPLIALALSYQQSLRLGGHFLFFVRGHFGEGINDLLGINPWVCLCSVILYREEMEASRRETDCSRDVAFQ